jgi:DNA-binding NarL/FixJ family response regulator
MAPLRILVAVDHDLLRRGITSLLEDQRGWEVCGEARTGIEAVSRAEQLQPDVAILDITMPQLNGLDATRKIRKASWQTEILLLSVQYSDRLVQDSFEAGALGYLLKSDSGQHLVKAVETLALHKPFYTARAK